MEGADPVPGSDCPVRAFGGLQSLVRVERDKGMQLAVVFGDAFQQPFHDGARGDLTRLQTAGQLGGGEECQIAVAGAGARGVHGVAPSFPDQTTLRRTCCRLDV